MKMYVLFNPCPIYDRFDIFVALAIYVLVKKCIAVSYQHKVLAIEAKLDSIVTELFTERLHSHLCAKSLIKGCCKFTNGGSVLSFKFCHIVCFDG